MPNRLASAPLLLAALLLAACSQPSRAPAAASAPPAQPPVQAAAPASSGGAAAAPQAAAQPAALPPRPVTVRWYSITNANQSYVPTLIMEQGIGQKYGIEIQLTPISNTGQQWTAMRAGEADVSSGSSLDLLRQRQQGLPAKAVITWSRFNNPIVALSSKPYARLSDLRGAKVGTPTDTLLDWQILRAAGLRGEGFDVGRDAQPQNAAPGLINGLMDKGDLDAALQFSDFTLAPVSQGKMKEITNIAQVMATAGFDPQAFYLTYNLLDAWREKNPPDAPARLVAAMLEAMDLMQTDDAIWPALAKRSGVEDPQLLPLYVEKQRTNMRVDYGAEKLPPTQAVVDALVDTVGQAPVGVTRVDPAAFDFESYEAAKRLRPQ